MSYLVIARKWRPQTFEEVVGQPHVTRTLQNAIRLDRIAHAYLFTGARGVGKTSIARILAKALNCEKGPAPSPCNECSNCREIAQGNSVDVLEIDGASNRGIDSIRELRETVRYRPAKGRYKVYIIDEVHMLTTEAFNALLKTLEEPPSHVIFVFATTEPHKIPATILSRCQRFDFRRITLPQLIEHLRKITSLEGAQFSDAVLYAIAREADGSMRDSQSLLEQLLAFSGDGLPDEEILDILGVIDRRSVLLAGDAILSGNAQACLDLVGDLYRRGIDSRRFCQQLCDHFRNLLFLAIGDARESRLDLPGDEKELLKQQVGKTTEESLHVYFQMLLRGEEEIRRSSMPKIALEMLLLRMAQLPRLESFNALLDRIGTLERSLKEGPAAGGGGRASEMLSESRPVFAAQPPVRTAMAPKLPEVSPQAPAPPRQPATVAQSAVPPQAPESPQPAAAPAPPPVPAAMAEPESAPGPAPSVEPSGPVATEGEPEKKEADPEPADAEAGELPAPPPVEDAEFFPPEAKDISPADADEEEAEKGGGGSALPASEAIERWPGFIQFMKERHPMLWAKVAHCGIRAVAERRLELEVPEIYQKTANGPEFTEKLNAASAGFFGCEYEWVIINKEPVKGRIAPAQPAANPRATGKQVLDHPAVQQAIEILGAELVEIKPIKSSGSGGPRGGKRTGKSN